MVTTQHPTSHHNTRRARSVNTHHAHNTHHTTTPTTPSTTTPLHDDTTHCSEPPHQHTHHHAPTPATPTTPPTHQSVSAHQHPQSPHKHTTAVHTLQQHTTVNSRQQKTLKHRNLLKPKRKRMAQWLRFLHAHYRPGFVRCIIYNCVHLVVYLSLHDPFFLGMGIP